MPDAPTFNLEEVVALDPTDTTAFTPDHKTFLDTHKDELTSDELVKFGYETNLPKPPEVKTPETPAAPAAAAGNDDVDAEDEKVIGKILDKRLGPLEKQNQELEVRVAVNSFLADNPDFAKYKNQITEFKKHPDYRNVPVAQIAKMVASDDLIKIGARKEREAARNAGATRQPGNGARPAGGQKDWGTVSKEEFEAKRLEVLGHR